MSPSCFNFTAVSTILVSQQALKIVQNAEELAQTLSYFASDALVRRQWGERAKQAVATHGGALMQQLALVQAILATAGVMHKVAHVPQDNR